MKRYNKDTDINFVKGLTVTIVITYFKQLTTVSFGNYSLYLQALKYI